MNPYFKETVETKEISGPEKSKLSTAFENEKKSDVRSVQTVEPNINAELEGKNTPEQMWNTSEFAFRWTA